MPHGHVKPNDDGSKARCGGPAFCDECAVEAGYPSSERYYEAHKAADAPVGPPQYEYCPDCACAACIFVRGSAK
jgi:hypothetical protein